MSSFEAEQDQQPDATDDIESLRRVLEEEKDRTLRLLADFENFRKRVARDHQAGQQEGRRAALLPLLAVLDTLERGLAAGSTDQAFIDGMQATQRKFVAALREAGAEPVETVGRPFDPHVHEIVATVPASDAEPGSIVEEVRRGWRLGNDLLRPAQVIVAASLEQETNESWQ